MKSMEEDHFLQVSEDGTGDNGNQVEAIIYLPKDPGRMDTIRMMMEASLSLNLEYVRCARGEMVGSGTISRILGDTLRVVKRTLDNGSTLDVRVVSAEKN